MTMTTRLLSVSVPVADQDAALRFYTEVLRCELRADVELWPGARLIEVAPPGSSVSLLLLPPDSQIPVAIRLGTSDAQRAHDKVRGSGATLHNDEPLSMVGIPAMFSFTDPDGNGLVYLEDANDSQPLPADTARPSDEGAPA